MRCFIAIEPNDSVRRYLSNIQQNLRDTGVTGNYSRVENIHLTVKFLGEIDEICFKEVCTIAQEVAKTMKRFVLTLDNLGKFNRRNKSIIWAGVKSNQLLMEVFEMTQKKLNTVISGLRNEYYTPHITLIREAIVPKHLQLKSVMDLDCAPNFEVNGLSVMESTRINGILVYKRRSFAPFM